jgi:hypothetical protein
MTKNPSYALGLIDQWKQFPISHRPIIISSFSTLSSDWKILEKNLPSPNERLNSLKILSEYFVVGGALMPMIYTNNNCKSNKETQKSLLKKFIIALKTHKVSFSLLGFLELRSYFYLKKNYFEKIGLSLENPTVFFEKQNQEAQINYYSLSIKYQLMPRLSHEHFLEFLSPKDAITVLLAYYYYYQKMLGVSRKAFRYASYQINLLTEKKFYKYVKEDRLTEINGIGESIAFNIKDFLYNKKFYFWENFYKKSIFYK